jgi:tetratricopeptide (TPR) repeat protein
MMTCILFIPCSQVCAGSPAKLVKEGNEAYLAGKYDDALSAYEEAFVEAPEAPQIYFNKGASLYQKGDYSGAAEAFEKAALKSKDIRLEASSKFNLGNCAFREAERQQDSDLNKALEACGRSIQHYQDALDLDPDFTEAAENIEVVRLVMKTILDEINKQKEAQKKQQEAMQKTAKQLKDLIEKQQTALTRNQQLQNDRRQKGDSPELRDKIQDLARDQKDLKKETEALAKNMPKPSGQNTSPAESPAQQHLKNAAKEQAAASGNLEQQNMSEAENNQKKALEALKKALSSLGENKKCEGQQQEQQQQDGGQQEKQQQAQSSDEPSQCEESQEAMAQMSDDAKDILEEEKENKNRRRMQSAGGHRDVDRDW